MGDVTYWHWLMLALVLIIAESLGAAGFLIALSLSAAATAFCAWLGDCMVTTQLLFFSFYSVLFAFIWWQLISRKAEQNPNLINQPLEQFIGQTAFLISPISNGVGKVRLNDSVWLVTGAELPAGQTVIIIGTKNGLLLVERKPD